MTLTTHAKKLILPTHALAAIGIYLAFQNPHLLLFSFVGWLAFGPIGVGLGYHRLLAHMSFGCHKISKIFLLGMATLSGQGSALSWAAVHRQHHSFADTHLDPHSPRQGFWHAYILWQMLESSSAPNIPLPKDLSREALLRWQHRNYYLIFWTAFSLLTLIYWPLGIFLMAIPSVVYFHQVNLVDTICHSQKFGYRNSETLDDSRNHFLLGIITLGVGFHNNHHANPESWNFKRKWFEWDIGGWVVRLIKTR